MEAQDRDDLKRLLVSFSGGRTSGYMTRRILQEWRDKYDEIIVLFSNTGQEHELTLEFVRDCDKYFDFNTVWLEAVVDPRPGKGVRHKVVDFDTASRDGRPFRDVIEKYGIPNPGSPICTDRLKTIPMRSYIRDVLHMKSLDYHQCVGIRVDEIDRMSPVADRNNVQYPLIGWGVDKRMVHSWWATQSFDLMLQDELDGNCRWCWKKSTRKLLTIAKREPSAFDFPLAMEKAHPHKISSRTGKKHHRTFFRGNRSASDILAASREPFTPWAPDVDPQTGLFDDLDRSGGPCGSESCEVEYI